jgi:pyrroloquinoline quinone biosynthesis protein D
VEVGTVTILAGGIMHQLNLMGGEIWKLCDGGLDRDSVVAKLLDQFDVDLDTLRDDANAFIDDMMQKGLMHEK